VEVVNTGSAILDMYLLLISISSVCNIALALIRHFLVDDLQCEIRV
jgi:hypothetical protein